DILTLSNKKVGDSSGLNMAKVDNILEHGKKGSKDALVYAYHQGLLKMDEANQEEYHQVVDAINEYAYRKGGGRGEMPDDFDVKKNVTVVYKGDAKKPDANAETKIKNMYVNVKIKKDGTTTSETKTETKVQPSSDPSLEKEGSGSERQERRKALAGDALNKDKKS
ncbi:MAG TPA: hypothetical protein VEC17_02600, partial [Candidatus Binatia bacterium]|nr:hypothetical protein [Candidatus Binatia bacterium]